MANGEKEVARYGWNVDSEREIGKRWCEKVSRSQIVKGLVNKDQRNGESEGGNEEPLRGEEIISFITLPKKK